jgi:hypothetical protein
MTKGEHARRGTATNDRKKDAKKERTRNSKKVRPRKQVQEKMRSNLIDQSVTSSFSLHMQRKAH